MSTIGMRAVDKEPLDAVDSLFGMTSASGIRVGPRPITVEKASQAILASSTATAVLGALDTAVQNANDRIDALQVSGDTVTMGTWAALSAVAGTRNGQRGEVTGPDAGTHTDPVVGGAKANVGIYSWSTSPAGWRWLDVNDYTTLIAAVSAAAGSEGSLANRIDRLAVRHGVNVLKYSRLDRGVLNPEVVNGSPVEEIPQSIPTLRQLGFSHALVWRAGAEYVRWVPDAGEKAYLLGKYVCAGFFAHSAGGTFMPYAIARVEGNGSVNIAITGNTNNYVAVGSNTRMLYQFGQMPQLGDPNLASADDFAAMRIGYSSNPAAANQLRATGFFLGFRDTPWTLADLPVLQAALDEALLLTSEDGPILTLDASGNGSVEVMSGDTTIRRDFVVPQPPQIILPAGAAPSWKMTGDYIDGTLYRAMTDDEAPYNVNGAHMGGQHQWGAGRTTATAHGKDSTDVGQVLSIGGVQYVLIAVVDANTLILVRRNADGLPPTGAYTHVSGGTHTGGFTVTGVPVAASYSPITVNRRLDMLLDGRKIKQTARPRSFVDRSSIRESYDALDRETVIEWIVAHGGIAGLTGNPLFSVSNGYTYDQDGNMTLVMDFVARQSLTLNWIYGLQVQLADATQWYIPKTTPFVQDAVSYDFAMIQPAAAPATELRFSTANTVAGGLFLDRFVTFSANYGMAVGFLPIQAADPTERRSTYVTGANTGMSIATTGKTYMRILNQGGGVKSAGFALGWVGYRNLFKRVPERTCSYAVRAGEADFFFADWHDRKFVDTIELPPDYYGRKFSIVEKSDTVELLNSQLNGRLMVDVDAAGSYGYLVLRVEK